MKKLSSRFSLKCSVGNNFLDYEYIRPHITERDTEILLNFHGTVSRLKTEEEESLMCR